MRSLSAGEHHALSNSSEQINRLITHLKEHAIRTDGPFTLRSGAVTSWYLDARQTTFDGSGAVLVGEAVLPHVPEEAEAVGGMTIGADPIAVATAMIAARAGRALRAFSIRKEAKEHGTGGRLVGPVRPGAKVTMLEDTSTTGAALVKAIGAARESGLVVVSAVCLVDRSAGRTTDRLGELDVPYLALLTPDMLGLD